MGAFTRFPFPRGRNFVEVTFGNKAIRFDRIRVGGCVVAYGRSGAACFRQAFYGGFWGRCTNRLWMFRCSCFCEEGDLAGCLGLRGDCFGFSVALRLC